MKNWTYYCDASKTDAENARNLYTDLHKDFESKELDSVSDLLNPNYIELRLASDVVLLSLCRGTFDFLHDFSHWKRTVSFVEHILKQRGVDTRKVMRGLI